jgi:Ca2+-transporting ATPase
LEKGDGAVNKRKAAAIIFIPPISPPTTTSSSPSLFGKMSGRTSLPIIMTTDDTRMEGAAPAITSAGGVSEHHRNGSLQVPTPADVSPVTPLTADSTFSDDISAKPLLKVEGDKLSNASALNDTIEVDTIASPSWKEDTTIQMSSSQNKVHPSSIISTEKASRWTRFKTNLKSRSRKGRVAAQAKILEEEKERIRNIDPTPFQYGPTQLADLVDPKSIAKLRDMGGVDRLLAGLGTDPVRGLDKGSHSEPQGEGWVDATVEDRRRVYGENALPVKEGKSLLLLMWLALQDRILILLIVAAIVSLALGLYTDLGAPPERVPCEFPPPGETECELPDVDWVEGLAILVAVAIVDIVGSLNDWQKERQFKVLNAKREERDVQILRDGQPVMISVYDVQVGDICQLEPGEVIPCDGIFLRGHNVKVDESTATGESDLIRKVPYEECLQDLEKVEQDGTKKPNRDCFLISGSRCLEGSGDYCVIAVGPTSFNGKLLMSLRTDSELTPLQIKLNRLAEIIAYCGMAAGITLFVALMIRFFVQLANPVNGIPLTPNQKAQDFIDILISATVLIVVAIPVGSL